jgi:phage terminase large subunit
MIAEFPEKLQILWEPSRYKILYGGRGGSKSWGVARWLLLDGARRPLRILCCRETMRSMADSVHRLLSDQIVKLGLESHYEIEKSTITGRNGTEFIFAGLKHNVSNIKSLEAVDRVFVEEAQTVSRSSWQTLIPTIRKADSEIIVVFNPDLATDDTYQRFVVNPPPGAKVVRIGWEDNPWFPDVLRDEMEYLRERNPEEYLHIWGGECINTLEGAIYANELRMVDREQRITRVPYDPSKPVNSYWDIGYGDNCAIWFAQAGAFEYRLIDFLENSQQPLSWYLKELQAKPYIYGAHHLPWDARPKQFGSGRSVEELMREAGFHVEIVTKLSVTDGINAARTVFPLCYFDAEKCADGIQSLRHYRYGENKTLGVPTREPIHDEHSHAADAWRYLAVSIRAPDLKQKDETLAGDYSYYGSQSDAWMG